MKTTIVLVVLCTLLAVVSAKAPKWHELEGYTFAAYVKDLKKNYESGSPEYEKREKLFVGRLAGIRAHNADKTQTYKQGVNQFTDMTDAERTAMNGNLPQSQARESTPLRQHVRTLEALPHSIDLRTASPPILTAVKDQGQCGSCWAHAATEQVESYSAKATGELFVLSQQQVASCTPNPNKCGGTGGCNGGTAELAFDAVVAKGGLTQEWMYGYESYFGENFECVFNASKTKPVTSISGYVAVARNDAGAVMDALATAGPLAISVDASHWFEYESGIFNGCPYAKNISMDHAVQLIGYGHDSDLNEDYWLVRNSWNAGYGEDGYIRLARPTQPTCGWNIDWTTAGGGCTGQQNTIWSCGTCGILYDLVYPVVDEKP